MGTSHLETFVQYVQCFGTLSTNDRINAIGLLLAIVPDRGDQDITSVNSRTTNG